MGGDILLEGSKFILITQIKNKKGGGVARTCPICSSEFIVFKNEMVMINLVALTFYHDLALMPCNSTPCTGLGLSVD
jgi:hypothetical protein